MESFPRGFSSWLANLPTRTGLSSLHKKFPKGEVRSHDWSLKEKVSFSLGIVIILSMFTGSTLLSSITFSSSLLSYATNASTSFAIDGYDGRACSARSCVAATGLTTSNSNDLILVCASAVSGRTVTSIKDSTGSLGFSLRTGFTQASGPQVELWYAIASGVLSFDKLNVTFSAAGANSFTVFGISGADLTTVFDGSATNGWSDKVSETPNATITTTESSDILVGCETTNVGGTQKAGPGFNLIQALSSVGESSAVQYALGSTAQAGLNIRFGTQAASTNKWSMVAFSIIKATSSPTFFGIDGSDGTTCALQSCVSSTGLTTAGTDDLIVVCASSVSGRVVSSIRDSAVALNFILEKSFTQASGPRVEMWYAIVLHPLNFDKLNVTFNTGGSDSFIAFGVSGADLGT